MLLLQATAVHTVRMLQQALDSSEPLAVHGTHCHASSPGWYCAQALDTLNTPTPDMQVHSAAPVQLVHLLSLNAFFTYGICWPVHLFSLCTCPPVSLHCVHKRR